MEIHNKSYPNDVVSFNIKNDIKFISDEGPAEKSFYKKHGLSNCFCARHIIGDNGAFTPLSQIATEVFLIRTIDEWKERRNEIYTRLKDLYHIACEHSPQSKEVQKIEKFAQNLGLSKDLEHSTEPDELYIDSFGNIIDGDDNITCYLPFSRDFSPNTTNSTEGPHRYYNDFSDQEQTLWKIQ